MYKFVKADPTLEENFWDLNPQHRFIDPFKSLYDRDSSKNKVKSSKEMWCLWMYCDPSYDNKVYRLSEGDKVTTIKNYYKDFDFNDPLIQMCISAYDDMCLTPAARAFKEEERSFAKRAAVIRDSVYTLSEPMRDASGNIITHNGRPIIIPGTAKELDSLRKNTLDILKKYQQAKKVFEEEQRGEPKLFGGGVETLMEEGGLILLDDEEE